MGKSLRWRRQARNQRDVHDRTHSERFLAWVRVERAESRVRLARIDVTKARQRLDDASLEAERAREECRRLGGS